MNPLLAFGVGILIGAVLIGLGFLLFRSRPTGFFAPARASSVPSILLAKQILRELAGFAVIIDRTGTPVYANKAAREHDGITVIDRVFRSDDFREQVLEVLDEGETFTLEPESANPGEAVRLHMFRLDDDHVVVLADDLGEAKRLDAIRRDFIANMSHELKTPIAAIGLLSEALHEAADRPDIVRKFSKKMLVETKRLSDLSRDVIRLSEAQATFGDREHDEILLKDLVHGELERHTEYALQQGVTLSLRDTTKKKQTPMMLGRRSALGVAVSNLISNAIHHSPRGGQVEITLSLEGASFFVTVTDEGDGIEAEYLPRIFERFFRVDRARSRNEGGTGLGLSIVRHTMRAHGGDVDVWSTPGEGANFLLTFPIMDAAETRKVLKRRAAESAMITRAQVVAERQAPLVETPAKPAVAAAKVSAAARSDVKKADSKKSDSKKSDAKKPDAKKAKSGSKKADLKKTAVKKSASKPKPKAQVLAASSRSEATLHDKIEAAVKQSQETDAARKTRTLDEQKGNEE